MIQVIPNPDDIAAVESELLEASTQAGSSLLRRLGEEGVSKLHDLDLEAGHPALAELWAMTEVEAQPDSSLLLEVFSHAEEMTFYGKTSRPDLGRIKSSRYPIDGKALLSILESGAKPHEIYAVMGEYLAFPRPGFEGEFMATSHGIGDFTAGITSPDAYVFTKGVDHPGVTGNEHIQNVSDELDSVADAMAEDYQNEVAELMNS